MSSVQAKCTSCGGIISVEENYEYAVCPFCNTTFIVEEAVNKYNIEVETNMESTPSPVVNENMFSEIDYKSLDIVMQIQSVRRMGITAYIIAFFDPIVSLILAIMGKNRGYSFSDTPNELKESLENAIDYNERAKKLSILFLFIDIIIGIIGFIVYSEM